MKIILNNRPPLGGFFSCKSRAPPFTNPVPILLIQFVWVDLWLLASHQINNVAKIARDNEGPVAVLVQRGFVILSFEHKHSRGNYI